jgi:hypothetical protein
MTTAAGDVKDVQRVADLVMRAQDGAAVAGALIGRVGHAKVSEADQAAAAVQARDLCLKAKDDCRDALTRLEAMGAEMRGPGGSEPHPASVAAGGVPLRLLDTPAVRELLAAVEAAAEKAEAVDRERGWVDGDGDPIGWAESLRGMAIRLRMEAEGPRGLDGR